MSDEDIPQQLELVPPVHAGRREYDPIIAHIIENQGTFAAQIKEIATDLREMRQDGREGQAALNRHMLDEEGTIIELTEQLKHLPPPEQWAKLDALIQAQEEQTAFWKDIKKTLYKKTIVAVFGFVGVAVLWYLWQGHPPH